MKGQHLLVLFSLLLTIVIIGCDLFQTREPQLPTQNSSTREPPASAEIVLRNFRYAIIEYNVDNYMRCFADTSLRQFVFIPSNYYGVFNQWNVESERQYFLNLGAPPSNTPPTLTVTVIDSSLSSDTARYSINYRLFFPHHRTDVAQTVQGNMQLYFLRDQQALWYIHRWEDSRTTTDSTWSYLKANI